MLVRHTMMQVDLVGACRAFVSVSERGSFTVGAAALRMSQSVASRRVAALEERYGERLFERTARRAVLTPFGRELLPAARQLVRTADVLDHEAEVAKRRPWRLAVPGVCSTASLAQLIAEARLHDVVLEVQVASASERTDLLHSQQVRAALLATPPDESQWSVPLGLAGDLEVTRVFIATLRPPRTTTARSRTSSPPARRIWIQPEDDVPHIRDPLTRLRDAAGLRPTQVAIAPDLTTAVAETLCSRDLLLCSPDQAAGLGLTWRPIGDLTLTRGFALTAAPAVDVDFFHTQLSDAVARCLGVQP
ncbi:LysR family transcriptional regulator [Kribbella italica]|uniref:DNA-binding transcriptional LysR family regulator n=1 Tax=Kribbella italica TaxID=1540520 RepID=A0A7W9J6B5_9ACTN|nr:LysR family transcriptional regulator [Kribbella italica]MBB5835917.1 DNA-binding transcriptional LysR family regulator [Kribbella italica]